MMIDLAEWIERHSQWMPILIFFARVIDVSFGTIRTIFVVRGRRGLAAMLGFCEVIIWILALSSVVTMLNQPLNIIGYAAGFATGNWVGVAIETKLALGEQIVRLISQLPSRELATHLRQAGFQVTELGGHGPDGPVGVCFIPAPRRKVRRVLQLAREIDPEVFITVEDTRSTELTAYRHLAAKRGWRSVLFKK